MAIALAAGGAVFSLEGCRARTSETAAQRQKYTCPMHPQIVSDKPGQCPICRMELVPIQGGVPAPSAASSSVSGVPTPGRRVLYWYDPMAPGSHFDKPGKSPFMDMALLPKYADEEVTAGTQGARVEMSPEGMAAAGVATARVEKAKLEHVLRAVGTIEPDERTLVHIASRVAGRLDRLYVDFTGQSVRKGAPVFEIYSPELVTSQRELLLAADNLSRARASGDPAYIASAESLLASSRERLSRWGYSGDQVAEIERKRKPETEMVYRSPVSGTVIQKNAVAGQYVTEGQDLYVLADLTRVWLAVQVYEYELGNIRIGAPVRASVTSFPGREFLGRVAFVDPVIDAATRTGRLRVEIPNPDGVLKPGMFANAELRAGLAESLAVARSAVIDTGARQLVYVRTGPTTFAAREVRLGATAGDRVAVLSGLAEGDEVVTAAGFLIDAQSQLATGVSVQWGGATEVKATPSPAAGGPQ